ncbi:MULTISPECIES: hypothetical protein [Vibrio]|uniref:Uncharacterized protein n=1 Tax=Vibrio rotiferianus TaxID=190895 RepID=A0A510IFH6_9VIBR|nr:MULTISPECIES: hypothetical protein [Vibrio]BBL92307.1 hypothetical protein VroAM7_49600 [Vibrio rotiferianus]
MDMIVTHYLKTGSKSTHLTKFVKKMDRNQAKNLIDSLVSESYWFKKRVDFMAVHSNHYRARLEKLLKRLQKMLKRDLFEYEMINELYVERHFVLCYKQFVRLFVNGTDYEHVHGQDTLNCVYADPKRMKILYYTEGDVTVMTAVRKADYQRQLQYTAEDFE